MFLFEKEPNLNFTFNFLQHTLFGEIFNRKVSGIHHKNYINSDHIKIEKIVQGPDKNGIYEVLLKKRDYRFDENKNIKEWKEKKEKSTFFPDVWDENILYNECFHAFINKKKVSQNKTTIKWASHTISGIKVEIFTDKMGKLITIYPILTK